MRRRYRALALLVGLAVAVSLVAGLLASRARLGVLGDAQLERVRVGTAVVAARLEATGPDAPLQPLAEAYASLLLARVTLIAADGTVLADSALPAGGVAVMDDHGRRPEIVEASLVGLGNRVRRSATTAVEYLYGARRLDDRHGVRYARLAVPWSALRLEARRFGFVAGSWTLLATVVVGGVGYLGLRRRERAVQRVAESIERGVAGGGRVELAAVDSPHTGPLGEAIGALQAALETKVREVEADRSLLASVVSGMREGLLLVGPDRRVRLANDALRAILAVDFDPLGRNVTDAVRHPAVIEEIDAAFSAGGERSDSIVRVASTDQAFRLHTVTIGRDDPARRQVLVLFFDITQLERLETVRREFVANVSHELRTPLTSISAFVETLLDGGLDDPDEARRFLGIVRKHAERMGELIEDLTDLSLIETGAIRLEHEAVDAAAVVRDVVARLSPLLERRRVRVETELTQPCTIHADRRRLEQVLTNLVDNAAKFSRPGGTVRIVGVCAAGRAEVRVIDEGVGIAEDAREKIFHRFHRERRDGGEELRGTGLGLAIVKHLMRLHGGAVRVESELGHGATFIVEFPAPEAGTIEA